MKRQFFYTCGIDIYAVNVEKTRYSRARFENQHLLTIQDFKLKENQGFDMGEKVNIRTFIIIPEDENNGINIVEDIAESIILSHSNDEDKNTIKLSKYLEEALEVHKKYIEKNRSKLQKVTLDEVIVNESVMSKLKQTLKFLDKDSKKYADIGARMPKNILLYGPAGTGKTLIAKALGYESERKVFSASAAEFAEKYVGTGPRKIRDLFDNARKNKPAIIFIDEIDCIAMERSERSNGEDIKMLNQLLTELDGIGENKDITVICATNRIDILDPAFIRAGRFDRKIEIGLPNHNNRMRMFELYLNKVKHEDVDLEKLADMTEGCNGADINTVVNEAAILAVDKDMEKVTMQELTDKIKEMFGDNEKTEQEEVKYEAITIGF